MSQTAPEYARARRDLRDTVVKARIWTSLAFVDIRSKYRLSTLGSFWITLTTGALALAIGVFYGQFFGQDMSSYLPYFTTSYIAWIFISSVISEASQTLIGSGNLIKSSQLPIVFYVMRMLQRNFIIAGHNALVLIVMWPIVGWPLSAGTLLFIPGLVLLYLFLAGTSLFLAILCVRFRDIPPLIQALTQFLFFATPIIWYPEQLRFGEFVLYANPVAYLLMIVRDPILGRAVEPQAWLVAVVITAAALFAGAMMYVRYRRRIAYWV